MAGMCRNGRIAWVNLTDGKVREEHLNRDIYRKFIGGKGLGAYLLYKHLAAGADPLGPENILIFLTGPMQALRGPSTGRWSLVTKSPLTGFFLDSHCGGPLGREIKRAGYDAVCVKGRAPTPSVLIVTDDSIRIEDASKLWGLGIYNSTKELHSRFGNDAAVYTIGPAGERESLIAMGACEIAHQTGRGGTGAVVGSKNLKAVVARGSKAFEPADPEALRAVNREVAMSYKQNTTGFRDIGTAFLVDVANGLGQYPTRNWAAGYFELHENLDMYKVHEERWRGRHFSCPHCIMRCTHAYAVSDPEDPDQEVESTVEYETLGLMGGNLGIDRPEAVLQLNYLSDDLGLDTISAGNVIGLVMEALEKGIVSEEQLGFSLSFGDARGALRLLKMIALREGFGDILADGVKRAAERIGNGAAELAVHVKGLECAAWDPRGRKGMGLSYATADVGASHLRGWPATTDPPDTSALDVVESMVRARDEKVLTDSLVLCHFTYHLPLTLEQKIRLLNGASGESYTEEDIFLFAKRVAVLTRSFNVREGVSRKDDELPPKFWTPQSQGPREGRTAFVNREDFEASLDVFYRLRGWDQNGVPTKETIEEVGLGSFIRLT